MRQMLGWWFVGHRWIRSAAAEEDWLADFGQLAPETEDFELDAVLDRPAAAGEPSVGALVRAIGMQPVVHAAFRRCEVVRGTRHGKALRPPYEKPEPPIAGHDGDPREKAGR